MTDHFDESIMTGTRLIAGSDAQRLRNVVMACCESSMASSMFTSSICAPVSTCCRATSRAASYSPLRISFANRADPVTLHRSPTLTKPVSAPQVRGSSPLSRSRGAMVGSARGGTFCTASAMALMWAGVVPQQPPAKLSSPARANSPSIPAMYSGPST